MADRTGNRWGALRAFGATLQDIGSSLRGEQPVALANLQREEEASLDDVIKAALLQQLGLISPVSLQPEGETAVLPPPQGKIEDISPLRTSAASDVARQEFQKFLGQIPPTQIGVTSLVPFKVGQTPESQLSQQVYKEVASQQGKEAAKLSVTSRQIENMARQTMSQLKGMWKQQGGSGLIKGLGGLFKYSLEKVTGTPMDTSLIGAFEGMRNDFATRLGRIYGGSGRIAAKIIAMAKKSLPERFDTVQQAADKIAQTIWNAENIARAAKGLPPLSEKQKIKWAKEVLAAPAAKPIPVKNIPKGVSYSTKPVSSDEEILKQFNLNPDEWEIVR